MAAADEADRAGLGGLGGDIADQERAFPILRHSADDVGRDRVGAHVDEAEFLIGERLGDFLHRADHIEGRADDDVEALAGGAGEGRLELGYRTRLNHDILRVEILLRFLHSLDHHVVERFVAKARFGRDHRDARGGDCGRRRGHGKNRKRRKSSFEAKIKHVTPSVYVAWQAPLLIGGLSPVPVQTAWLAFRAAAMNA